MRFHQEGEPVFVYLVSTLPPSARKPPLRLTWPAAFEQNGPPPIREDRYFVSPNCVLAAGAVFATVPLIPSKDCPPLSSEIVSISQNTLLPAISFMPPGISRPLVERIPRPPIAGVPSCRQNFRATQDSPAGAPLVGARFVLRRSDRVPALRRHPSSQTGFSGGAEIPHPPIAVVVAPNLIHLPTTSHYKEFGTRCGAFRIPTFQTNYK